MITLRKLYNLLHYDPVTGAFTWRVRRGGKGAGARAGSKKKQGWRAIGIDGQVYSESRLAWFYMKKRWPKNEVDHENRVRDDNHWPNLREATRKTQMGNYNLRKDNCSGVRGVGWNKALGKWRVRLAGKVLGYFSDLSEAKITYDAAARKRYGKYYHSP